MSETLIGEIIRQWRVIEGFEQKDLAAEIGIHPSTLCRLEKGKSVDMQATAKIIMWLFK